MLVHSQANHSSLVGLATGAISLVQGVRLRGHLDNPETLKSL